MYPGPLFYHLIHWVVSALALWATSMLVPGFRLKNFGSALIASFAIGVAEVTIRPILLFLTFPINILTLGLFTFVVNGVVLKICASILRDFEIKTWFAAIFGAFLLTLISSLLHYLII